MYLGSTHLRRRLAILFMWMMLVLLSAQSMGYLHRISHANWGRSTQLSASASAGQSSEFSEKSISRSEAEHHSCLLIDALTLGDGVHAGSPDFPPNFSVALWLTPSHAQFWQAILHLAFSSRAPPF